MIYSPWKASLADQKKYGCIIGKDYPSPIVDNEEVRNVNLEKMKKAFADNREVEEEKDSEPILKQRKKEIIEKRKNKEEKMRNSNLSSFLNKGK